MNLSWSAPSGEEVSSYNLYKALEEITSISELTPIQTGITTTTAQDTVEEELIYYYAVTAIDSVGNESELSVNATLIYDITPPVTTLTPGGTLYYDDAGNSYAGLSYTYSLAATDNLDETFLRYEVHVSTEANFSLSEDTKVAEITEQSTTSYTVTGLSSLSTYYAKVTVVFTDETRIQSNETSGSTRADIIIEYTYDENGNRVEMKETKWPDTYVTSYEYDPLNRLRKLTSHLDKSIYYEYDGNGNRVKMIDPEGGITTYQYNGNNQLLSLTNPQGETTSYGYDKAGNQILVNYSNGTYSTYSYNERNWLTELINHGSTISSFSYQHDLVGNRIRVTEADGSVVSYQYDSLYRLIREERSGSISYEASYSYDSVGNRLTKEETKGIEPLQGSADFSPDTFNINSSGEWVTVYLSPQPGEKDKAWIVGLNDTSIHPIKAERIEEDNVKFNRRSVAEVSGGYVGKDVSYTVVWVIGEKIYKAQTDAVRMIQKGTPSKKKAPAPTADLPPSLFATTVRTDYEYNSSNQLMAEVTQEVQGEGSPRTTTYSYDSNGNQISKTRVNGSGAAQTTTYEWDFENRLTSVSSPQGTTTYEYDGDGNRTSKTNPSGTINYINDVNQPLVQVLMEEDEGGNVLASYTIGNDLISCHSPATAQTPAQTHWYHYDGLGSVRQLTDSTGAVVADYVYDAWGNILASTDETGNVYGFTGEQQFGDGDGLVYLRARYHDPRIGRFISKDPILVPMWTLSRELWVWFEPLLVEDPQAFYPYLYARDNPANLTDANGLACGPGALGDILVPDTIPTVYNFHDPCENHDKCYGTCGKPKSDCDEAFYDEMLQQCNSLRWKSNYLNCLFAARTYYLAVKYAGGKSYGVAQRKAGCRPCKEQ